MQRERTAMQSKLKKLAFLPISHMQLKLQWINLIAHEWIIVWALIVFVHIVMERVVLWI